jgi:hypothetical protein
MDFARARLILLAMESLWPLLDSAGRMMRARMYVYCVLSDRRMIMVL